MPPANGGDSRGRRSLLRAASSGILITLACVLAPLSVASVWAGTELSDTDQYVQTVAPIADDNAVQGALADKVTTAVVENLDVEALATDVAPIAGGVEGLTRDQVDRFLAGHQFARLWERVNHNAHEQVVKLLEDGHARGVSTEGDAITLELGPIIEQVKNRLVAQGFDLANNIPAVDQSFVLVRSETVTQARSLYRLINMLSVWLPIIACALFVAGMVLADDRRRSLLKGALGVVAATVVLGLALSLARVWSVDAVPADVLTEPAAGAVFDVVVRPLTSRLQALAGLGLVVAVGAFLTGRPVASRRSRVPGAPQMQPATAHRQVTPQG